MSSLSKIWVAVERDYEVVVVSADQMRSLVISALLLLLQETTG
jgi:hypothetical protein